MRAIFFVCLAACGDPGAASFGDPVDDPQVPPRGFDDILTWIEAGYYNDWSCEPEKHPPAPGSPHGSNRICSNDALVAAAAGDGEFPVGAAGIKEIFSGDQIELYAVYRKMTQAAGGDSWYWFEGVRGDVIANDVGDGTCTGCHGGAPRDFVFTIIAP